MATFPPSSINREPTHAPRSRRCPQSPPPKLCVRRRSGTGRTNTVNPSGEESHYGRDKFSAPARGGTTPRYRSDPGQRISRLQQTAPELPRLEHRECARREGVAEEH